MQKAMDELEEPATTNNRLRRVGGGRQARRTQAETLWADLAGLIEPDSRGDALSPLRWTCKSSRQLAEALNQQGHQVSRNLGAALLDEADYSLQANRQILAGSDQPDRDAQFRSSNDPTKTFLAHGWPVVWVDAKKNALVGTVKNGDQTWRPKGQPALVNGYDFPDPEHGKASP
jgi:hypothetical protein